MHIVFIDVETYSSENLTESGVHRYVEAPDFAVLWLSYKIDDRPVQTVDIYNADKKMLKYIAAMLMCEDVELHAWNAAFERLTINKHFGLNIPATKWHCTMVKALMAGYPGGLDNCAEAMQLPQKKFASGTALINYFSKPCKPTEKNDWRTRNLPADNMGKWLQYGNYNNQDVIVEYMADARLSHFIISEKERRLWLLDQQVNDRGIRCNLRFARNAILMSQVHDKRVANELKKLTGLENPNSLTQLKKWLAEKEPILQNVSLNKDGMEDVMKLVKTPTVRKALQLRGQTSSISIKKYNAILKAYCKDFRLRGMLQYCGAGKTWRWAGRIIQPHNLVKTEIKNIEYARNYVLKGNADALHQLWDSVPYCLSQLIRTCLVPEPERIFVISDLAAIEARILSWLAGELWRLDVFKGDGKIYEASAAKMFKVPLESIDKDSPYRARGKVSELALGYNGGVNALIRMGALKMGIKEDELLPLVSGWRNANKRIVAYWKEIEDLFLQAMDSGRSKNRHINFRYRDKRMEITLPSGHLLTYHKPRIVAGQITCVGVHPKTKRWSTLIIYGGLIVENIVQAIARDILAASMLRTPYDLVLHVHDESVFEVPIEHAANTAAEIHTAMKVVPDWAAGLPLDASTIISPFYRKD